MVQVLFVMEQHIGHRSFYLNLRQFIEATNKVSAKWIEITYAETPPSLVERIPFMPKRISGPLVGRNQARIGLRQPYDIAVFNTQVPAVLAGKIRQHKPYVICTDITPLQYDQMAEHYGHRPDRGGLLTRYKHAVNVATFRSATRLLPWSTWTRASLIQDYGVDPARIEVIPPGVDITTWQPGKKGKNERIRILFIGGDFYRKGGEFLLEAFRTLRPDQAELILVTRSQLPVEKGVIVYNDMKPNTPELIALSQSCDIFVLPTQAEAFGIAAVEATALGLPIIATKVGGLVDIVSQGANGFLIPPGDSQTLSEKLRLLVENENLRTQFGQAARERAMMLFDARKNAARMAEILYHVDNGDKANE